MLIKRIELYNYWLLTSYYIFGIKIYQKQVAYQVAYDEELQKFAL